MISFWIFAKLVAMRHGLLRPPEKLERASASGALAHGREIHLVIVGTAPVTLGAQFIFGSFFRALLEQTRAPR